MKRKLFKKIQKKQYLLEDSKIRLLNFDFVMIYIIHKMFVLLKNNLNYFKDTIFECFLRSITDFYFLKNYFFTTYNDGMF